MNRIRPASLVLTHTNGTPPEGQGAGRVIPSTVRVESKHGQPVDRLLSGLHAVAGGVDCVGKTCGFVRPRSIAGAPSPRRA